MNGTTDKIIYSHIKRPCEVLLASYLRSNLTGDCKDFVSARHQRTQTWWMDTGPQPANQTLQVIDRTSDPFTHYLHTHWCLLSDKHKLSLRLTSANSLTSCWEGQTVIAFPGTKHRVRFVARRKKQQCRGREEAMSARFWLKPVQVSQLWLSQSDIDVSTKSALPPSPKKNKQKKHKQNCIISAVISGVNALISYILLQGFCPIEMMTPH